MIQSDTIQITPEILRLIAGIDEFKGAWRTQIVEFAREHGRITIGDAIRLTGASRNTLKQHFRALVERGSLNQQGAGRGVWYELR